jgi:acetyl esterase/lipase
MHFALSAAAALAAVLAAGAAGAAGAANYEVATQPNLLYAEHDGTKLLGDLYLPKGLAKAPALIAIHGGGWQIGNRAFYKYWGPFLARNGYAVFAVDYRLGKPGVYPAAVYDAKAAIQFVRAKAADYGIDPDRIGLMGDSAGGHLSAMLALAGDQFTTAYRDDPNAATPASVKAVVAFYGVYDMMAQWEHDLVSRPRDNIAEKFLGASPMDNRRVYFDSSPMSYVTAGQNRPRFLLVHGTNDDIVDPPSQSGAFLTALTRAGIFVRRIVIPGAGHFWSADPFENDATSYGAVAAPRILLFLEGAL